jgi:hypothetical protein
MQGLAVQEEQRVSSCYGQCGREYHRAYHVITTAAKRKLLQHLMYAQVVVCMAGAREAERKEPSAEIVQH